VGKVNIKIDNEITVKDIQVYMEGTVTKFGSGAKVDCHKEFLGKKAFLLIKKDEDYLLMYQCLKVHKNLNRENLLFWLPINRDEFDEILSEMWNN